MRAVSRLIRPADRQNRAQSLAIELDLLSRPAVFPARVEITRDSVVSTTLFFVSDAQHVHTRMEKKGTDFAKLLDFGLPAIDSVGSGVARLVCPELFDCYVQPCPNAKAIAAQGSLFELCGRVSHPRLQCVPSRFNAVLDRLPGVFTGRCNL